jgi:uncharacterized protein
VRRYVPGVIDCDIHPQIGDREWFLEYIEPAQRKWFRTQPDFGLPGYPWAHPTSWFRQDVAQDGGPPGADVAAVRRDVLDSAGADLGILNADDAVLVSLMPSPYRAAALARAHNDWLRERWLAAEPRCPWHGWEFDLETGRCLDDPALRAAVYPVRVEAGRVLVRA